MNALDFSNGRDAVEQAVKRAESRTAAEVVCVVATESGRYDRAESLVGVVFALFGLAAADVAWNARLPNGGWGEPAPLLLLAAAVIVGFVSGVLLASVVHRLRRVFVSQRELDEEVEAGADRAWVRTGAGATKKRSGVLVYVSLFEHRVVVRLDEAVRAAAGEAFARELCAKAVEGLKAGKREAVLVELIDAVSAALAEKLPARPGEGDELPNHLVTWHPR